MIKSKQLAPFESDAEFNRVFGDAVTFEPKHGHITYTSAYANTVTSVSVGDNSDADYELLWNRHTIIIATECPNIGTLKFTTSSTVPTIQISNGFKKVDGCITSFAANSTYLIIVFYKMINIIKIV